MCSLLYVEVHVVLSVFSILSVWFSATVLPPAQVSVNFRTRASVRPLLSIAVSVQSLPLRLSSGYRCVLWRCLYPGGIGAYPGHPLSAS